MKKTVTKAIMLALVLAMAVCTAFAFAACGGDPSANDPVEQDPPVKHEGYWTDKAEYLQNETTTVHFDEDDVFSIAFATDTDIEDRNPYTLFNDKTGVTVELKITSHLDDMNSMAILLYAYFTDGVNVFKHRNPSSAGVECLRGVPQNAAATYKKTDTNFDFTRNIKFVICIPGTQVPLASFTNIRVYRGNYT